MTEVHVRTCTSGVSKCAGLITWRCILFHTTQLVQLLLVQCYSTGTLQLWTLGVAGGGEDAIDMNSASLFSILDGVILTLTRYTLWTSRYPLSQWAFNMGSFTKAEGFVFRFLHLHSFGNELLDVHVSIKDTILIKCCWVCNNHALMFTWPIFASATCICI